MLATNPIYIRLEAYALCSAHEQLTGEIESIREKVPNPNPKLLQAVRLRLNLTLALNLTLDLT